MTIIKKYSTQNLEMLSAIASKNVFENCSVFLHYEQYGKILITRKECFFVMIVCPEGIFLVSSKSHGFMLCVSPMISCSHGF